MSNEHNNAPAVPQGWDDDQVIRFASMILLQGNQTDSIEIRLQQFREHEKLRGSINPLLTPAVPDCEPIAWTVAGEVTNWSRDFSMYRTQHYVRPVYAATPAPAPAQEVGLTDAAGLSMLIAGALFDFGGYLTTHPDVIDVGSTALAGPVADRIKVFAAMRGLSLDDAAVMSWSEAVAALRAKGAV